MPRGFCLVLIVLTAQLSLSACRLLQHEEFSLPLDFLQERVKLELSVMQLDASPSSPGKGLDAAALEELAEEVRASLPDLLVLQNFSGPLLPELLKRIPAYRFEDLTTEANEDPQLASVLLFRKDRFEAETGRNLDVFLAPHAAVQRLVESASGKTVFVAHGFWQDEKLEERRLEWDDMVAHLWSRRGSSDALLMAGHWPEGTAGLQERSFLDAYSSLHPSLAQGSRDSFIFCEPKHCKVLSADIVKRTTQGRASRFRSWPLLSRLRLEASEQDRSWRLAKRPKRNPSH